MIAKSSRSTVQSKLISPLLKCVHIPDLCAIKEPGSRFRRFRQFGYRNVNIIGHSWGTVISRDAQYRGVGNIDTWVTMGSPLPRTTDRPDGLQKWLNFYSHTDPIVYSGPVLGDGFLWQKTFGISQYAVFGDHSNYWTNSWVHNIIGHRLEDQ